jgi:hypothetical protein
MFEFVSGLTTLKDKFKGYSNIPLHYLCNVLRYEYLFKVKRVHYPNDKAFTVLIIMESDCSDVQIKWVAEIFKYYMPVGTQVDIRREC